MGRPPKSAQELMDDPQETSFAPDTEAKVNPEKDLKDEDKAAWLKRRAKEDRDMKKNAKVTGSWYEIHGSKLLKKVTKKNGNTYSLYIGAVKKNKDLIETLKKQGKLK